MYDREKALVEAAGQNLAEALDLKDICRNVVEETMFFHDLSSELWDGLSLNQQKELVSEAFIDSTTLAIDDWRRNLREDDTVYWEDPDNGFSSGIYRINRINTELGRLTNSSDVLFLANEGSEAEVFASELLRVVPPAQSPSVSILLTLNITYTANGVPAKELKGNLEAMLEYAIGNGMLTGSTEAEVDSWTQSIDVIGEGENEDEKHDGWIVTVCRAGYGLKQIEIDGNVSRSEARNKALEKAGNYCFNEHDADYFVEDIVKR